MLENIIGYSVFCFISFLFITSTVYWCAMFVSQVKNGQEPRVKIKLNPVARFEQAKKIAIDKEQILHNG